jgi:hypothetical protein
MLKKKKKERKKEETSRKTLFKTIAVKERN